jgi:hypothetical protein
VLQLVPLPLSGSHRRQIIVGQWKADQVAKPGQGGLAADALEVSAFERGEVDLGIVGLTKPGSTVSVSAWLVFD